MSLTRLLWVVIAESIQVATVATASQKLLSSIVVSYVARALSLHKRVKTRQKVITR